MNLVSDTMGDGISSSAWSRGTSKPEKPTQGAPARAGCPAPRRNPLPAASTMRKTHRFLNRGRVPWMTKPAPQSAAQYLPPIAHTGRPPAAHSAFHLFCRQFRTPTRPVYSQEMKSFGPSMAKSKCPSSIWKRKGPGTK